jgi:hypothetical protein
MKPSGSFRMTIQSRLGESQIPDTATFAAVVKFPSESQLFDVDFEMD